MKTPLDRRTFLRTGASAAGLLALTNPITKAIAASCGVLTPPQTKGPFYPGESKFDQNADLTQVPGQSRRAEGQVVYVKGRVLDLECRPISGANVEIWQACASGKYNSPRDPNPAPLDPFFRYWAETFTNDAGEFAFKTVLPGAYPADTDWDRPPHIHFRVAKVRYQELITQMYFKDHPLNDKDLILQGLDEPGRASVIVDFRPSPSNLEPGSQVGNFDITLQRVRG